MFQWDRTEVSFEGLFESSIGIYMIQVMLRFPPMFYLHLTSELGPDALWDCTYRCITFLKAKRLLGEFIYFHN